MDNRQFTPRRAIARQRGRDRATDRRASSTPADSALAYQAPGAPPQRKQTEHSDSVPRYHRRHSHRHTTATSPSAIEQRIRITNRDRNKRINNICENQRALETRPMNTYVAAHKPRETTRQRGLIQRGQGYLAAHLRAGAKAKRITATNIDTNDT